jgi:hypothetical protein
VKLLTSSVATNNASGWIEIFFHKNVGMSTIVLCPGRFRYKMLYSLFIPLPHIFVREALKFLAFWDIIPYRLVRCYYCVYLSTICHARRNIAESFVFSSTLLRRKLAVCDITLSEA